MGYRSQGLWVIKGPVQNIQAAWAAIKLTHPNPSTDEDLTRCFSVYQVGDTGYIRLAYEDWKWYDSYPSIRWFDAVWAELESPEWGLAGTRLRIGEDQNDTEAASFCHTPDSDVPEICILHILDDQEPQPDDGSPLTNKDSKP